MKPLPINELLDPNLLVITLKNASSCSILEISSFWQSESAVEEVG